MPGGQPRAKLTYDDLLQFPDDGLRHEIIDGEHYVTGSPVTRHQRISRRFLVSIELYLREHPVGEIFDAPLDLLLSHHDIVEPDLIYVSAQRIDVITEKNLQGTPDLVIEILSPSTQSRDRGIKRDLYERAGVREYWVVDGDVSVVEVHRREGVTFGSPQVFQKYGAPLTTALLPGLTLNLAELLS